MKLEELEIPGCFKIEPPHFKDHRGSFCKIYHAPSFEKVGLKQPFVEMFYSTSVRGVLRGLHFQVPPSDHSKLVWCISGEIFDVFADIRKLSPAYGRAGTLRLKAGCGIYLPTGIAHGFYTLSETATVGYMVTSVHDPKRDGGIHWNSLDVPWPDAAPILSERDDALPEFESFDSPFVFGGD